MDAFKKNESSAGMKLSRSAQKVFDAIREFGPVSGGELWTAKGILPQTVFYHAKRMSAMTPKLVYVASVHPTRWSVGDQPDATEQSIEACESADNRRDAAIEGARLAREAAQIRPFRHWQDRALFGATGVAHVA